MSETNKDIDFRSNKLVDMRSVIMQMEKDLASSGLAHTFVASAPDALIDEMSEVLRYADRTNQLSQLLYRIDVSESTSAEVSDHYEDLSVRCWDRVFQKVWFRSYFKTGSK